MTEPQRSAHPIDTAMLRLLAPSALTIAMIAMLIIIKGHNESVETNGWVLAFAVGVPAGLWFGQRQENALRSAPPIATAVVVAVGAALLAAAFAASYWTGVGYRRSSALAFLAAGVSLLAPWIVARGSGPDGRLVGVLATSSLVSARAVTFGAAVAVILLMVPPEALTRGTLSAAVGLTALLAIAVGRGLSDGLSRRSQRIIVVLIALVVVGLVAALPDIRIFGYGLVHHQGFFLGPANAVLHGRAMLDGTWSQYGTGMESVLALIFSVTGKIGFGQLFLVTMTLTVAQFLIVLWTLRLAGLGVLLAAAALVTAVFSNVFVWWTFYAATPSVGPLRFGIPYVVVLLAVASARRGESRWMERAQVALVGVAAVWSLEAWVYSASAFAFVRLTTAVTMERGGVRFVVRSGLQSLAASAACVAAFSLGTWALSGGVNWGPYFDYISNYTGESFGQLPIVFFSPGPLMAATVFLSVCGLLWSLRAYPRWLTPELRAGLAGYGGFIVAAFTYYLGRSNNGNLMVLLVPVVALGFLWLHALKQRPAVPWARAGVVALLFAASWITVASFPSVKARWQLTLLAQAVPFADGESLSGGLSVRTTFRNIYGNPEMDPRAQPAAELLERHMPGEDRSLVITQPDLTTEILMRAGRGNTLPIAHALADDLIIDRLRGPVLETVDRLPVGTRLLTSPPDPNLTPLGGPGSFTGLQALALKRLKQRFDFHVLATNQDKMQIVELRAHRRPATAPRPSSSRR